MFKVFVDGQEGTTGLQIHERLAKRNDVELLVIDADKRKDLDERSGIDAKWGSWQSRITAPVAAFLSRHTQ